MISVTMIVVLHALGFDDRFGERRAFVSFIKTGIASGTGGGEKGLRLEVNFEKGMSRGILARDCAPLG